MEVIAQVSPRSAIGRSRRPGQRNVRRPLIGADPQIGLRIDPTRAPSLAAVQRTALAMPMSN